MKEWKRIIGFEDYQISNHGEVMNNKGKILKPFIVGQGYLCIHLFQNEIRTKKYIHRLVAEAFLAGGNQKKEVNHKNGDKLNNHVNNLEWCTRTENLNHSYYTLRNRVKPVKCLDNGVVYPSIHEAARQTGLNHTAISMCCDGRQKKTHGTHWGYVI